MPKPFLIESFEKYQQRVSKGEAPRKVLDSLGLERWCCRRMILSHVDLLHEAAQYE